MGNTIINQCVMCGDEIPEGYQICQECMDNFAITKGSMTMDKQEKIFDDFPTIDCNECEHYYTNACDGVSEGLERPCKTFLATRRVNIPLEINSLKNDFKRLVIAFHILGAGLLLHLIGHLINLY